MDQEKLNFINNEFPELLKKLTPDTPRKWGLMNPQQMVEHLTDYVRIASGKNPATVLTPEDHLPAYKRFLESDKQFKEDTKNPLNGGDPNPVRMQNLQDAIDEYLAEMQDFYSTFEKQPGKKTVHPSFGYLDSSDWVRMQYKHLKHHARQFGLLVD
jgi:oxepin-CoA hydrolase/3-oxo-5,6-dehydrosuberyl-CoA semialdehyde dehydrogenase